MASKGSGGAHLVVPRLFIPLPSPGKTLPSPPQSTNDSSELVKMFFDRQATGGGIDDCINNGVWLEADIHFPDTQRSVTTGCTFDVV